MMKSSRDILVLFRNEQMTEQDVELEIDMLDKLLLKSETAASFCTAHELVDRNKITSNKKKIIKATRFYRLKAFRFLINKN